MIAVSAAPAIHALTRGANNTDEDVTSLCLCFGTAAPMGVVPPHARQHGSHLISNFNVDFSEFSPRARAVLVTNATKGDGGTTKISPFEDFGPDVVECVLIGVDVRTLCRMRAVSWAFRRAAEVCTVSCTPIYLGCNFANMRGC